MRRTATASELLAPTSVLDPLEVPKRERVL